MVAGVAEPLFGEARAFQAGEHRSYNPTKNTIFMGLKSKVRIITACETRLGVYINCTYLTYVQFRNDYMG